MAGTEEEYRSLCTERNRKQSAYNSYASSNTAIRDKISRLKNAKRKVKDLKSDFKINKKNAKRIFDEQGYTWKGERYDDFCSSGVLLNAENENYYKNTLDHVLDSLNNEITRLENQLNSNLGIMGSLLSQINNLANAIENFFN